ncbi:MAG: glycosyltransferase family 2 protein [Proteobacteria bacterium]|nr:glycosyltransferase family 2 protein [Pseudomonadota bacterium]
MPTFAAAPRAADPPGAPSPEVSVVIPVRNEEGNIVPLVEEVEAALRGRVPFEVVVVDDGSSDGTGARLAEARARLPRLRVVRHRESAGQSAAIATGVKAARGRLIATLDGDGQNDPADLPALIARAGAAPAGGAGLLICGERRRRSDSGLKRLASRVANAVRARALGDRTPDTGCGLKVFPRALFLAFPEFDHMHRFLPALALRAGAEVVSVPVGHRPRRSGRSNYGVLDRLWVGIVDLVGVMWLMRRARRPVIEEDG